MPLPRNENKDTPGLGSSGGETTQALWGILLDSMGGPRCTAAVKVAEELGNHQDSPAGLCPFLKGPPAAGKPVGCG